MSCVERSFGKYQVVARSKPRKELMFSESCYHIPVDITLNRIRRLIIHKLVNHAATIGKISISD